MMINGKLIFKTFLLSGLIILVCFFLFGYKLESRPKEFKDIQAIQSKIQIGDWIVREGVGYESILIKKLSQSEYSHIGVILQVQPHIKIVHATTDDDEERLNQVLVSSLEEFTDQSHARKWSIFRYAGLNNAQRANIASALFQQNGQPFLLAVKNEPHRYCSTIIADQLPQIVQNTLKWSEVDFPGMHGALLFPNALLALNEVQLIYESNP